MKLWFSKKKGGHVLDDTDRDVSLETRQLRAELNRIKYDIERVRLERQLEAERQELADMKGMISDDGDDKNSVLLSLLPALLSQLGTGQSPAATSAVDSTSSPVAQPETVHFSDEDIIKIWDSIPRMQRKIIKALPDESIRQQLKERFKPDDDSINRALDFIHQA